MKRIELIEDDRPQRKMVRTVKRTGQVVYVPPPPTRFGPQTEETKKQLGNAATPTYPWDRQDGESPRMYAYFLVYRDLPVESRTIKKTAQYLDIKPSSCLSIGTKFKWRRRATAYMEHLEEESRKAKLREIEKAAADEVRAGKRLMNVASKALKGEYAIQPTTGAEAATMIKTGSEVRRRGLGLPKDNENKTTQVNVQINTIQGLTAKFEKMRRDDESVEVVE